MERALVISHSQRLHHHMVCGSTTKGHSRGIEFKHVRCSDHGRRFSQQEQHYRDEFSTYADVSTHSSDSSSSCLDDRIGSSTHISRHRALALLSPISLAIDPIVLASVRISIQTLSIDTVELFSPAGVPINKTMTERFIATVYCSGDYITEFITISPLYVTKTDVAPVPATTNQWFITLTWTPRDEQKGPQVFCAAPIDQNGLTGRQHCVNFVVGYEAPNLMNVTMVQGRPTAFSLSHHKRSSIFQDRLHLSAPSSPISHSSAFKVHVFLVSLIPLSPLLM